MTMNTELKLNEREWTCPECRSTHDRDGNASKNLKKEGIRILQEEKHITIIKTINDTTVGTTESHAFGDCIRPCSVKATVDELGIYSL